LKNDKLTPVGKILNNVPCNDLFMSLAVMYGKIYNCSRELLQIASLIEICKANINDLFYAPNIMNQEKMRKFDNIKKKIANKHGDHLTLLYISEQYILNKDNKDELNRWIREHSLKFNLLQQAHKNYKLSKKQLRLSVSIEELNNLDIKLFPEVNNMEIEDRVLFCLLAGLRLNTAVNKKGTDYYRANLSKLDKIKIHKYSFLQHKGKRPTDVMYHELFISMGYSNLSIVSVIPKKISKIVT
jgi:hypothetical protein